MCHRERMESDLIPAGPINVGSPLMHVSSVFTKPVSQEFYQQDGSPRLGWLLLISTRQISRSVPSHKRRDCRAEVMALSIKHLLHKLEGLSSNL